MRLRRRLNTVLLQWFLLLVLITGTVWVISFPGIRSTLVDERQLLARAIAHALDTTIASANQDLDRLSADLPVATGDPTPLLHAFRLHSPFNTATAIIDARGHVVASDPAGVAPLPLAALSAHEGVTALVRKSASDAPVLAMVQPFRHMGEDRYLVSELAPAGSALSLFLTALETDPSVRVVVVDRTDTIIAARDTGQLLRPLVADADALTVVVAMRYAPWRVIVQQPNAQAFAGLRSISRGLVITVALLLVMAVLLSRTLSRSVVTPIRQLSKQAEAMRAGDLSSKIAVTGDHEIAVLAHTLDEARAKLASTLGELQAFNERLEEQVASRTAVIAQQNEQRKVLVRKMLSATEDERRRLARELHDEIAQLLTVIQLSLHNVNDQSPEIVRATELLVKTQAEVHRIIHDLRPSLLDDLGLAAAMRSWAKDHLQHSDVQYTLEIEDELPHAPEIETVIFRIYQELVTNVLRHAQAEQVQIELYQRDGRLVLEVEDDGRGFDADAKTNRAGVTGMRERAGLVNGTISFDSEPGMGTHVVLEIPLK